MYKVAPRQCVSQYVRAGVEAFIPFALASTLEQVGVNSRVLLIEPSARRLDALDRLVRPSLASASGLR
jgi:hypothetical protein